MVGIFIDKIKSAFDTLSQFAANFHGGKMFAKILSERSKYIFIHEIFKIMNFFLIIKFNKTNIIQLIEIIEYNNTTMIELLV